MKTRISIMNKRIFCLCLLIVGLLGVSDVKADTQQVYYNEVKENATTISVSDNKVDATIVTSDTKELNSYTSTSYYYVSEDVTISDRVKVTGNVTLILADYAELTCSGGIDVQSEGHCE